MIQYKLDTKIYLEISDVAMLNRLVQLICSPLLCMFKELTNVIVYCPIKLFLFEGVIRVQTDKKTLKTTVIKNVTCSI